MSSALYRVTPTGTGREPDEYSRPTPHSLPCCTVFFWLVFTQASQEKETRIVGQCLILSKGVGIGLLTATSRMDVSSTPASYPVVPARKPLNWSTHFNFCLYVNILWSKILINQWKMYLWYVLCSRFERAGGKIAKKTVTNFQDLEHNFDIVINCTGLGAKYLCSDNKLVPIRGQVIKVCWWTLLVHWRFCFVTAIPGKLFLILERMTTDCGLHGSICKFKCYILDSGL
jgi:hypothetical protein